MDEHSGHMSMSSLTKEERAALAKIEAGELECDWCGVPLDARLIYDEDEPDVLVTVELFCRACNRVYKIATRDLLDWDSILDSLLKK